LTHKRNAYMTHYIKGGARTQPYENGLTLWALVRGAQNTSLQADRL
jgi:hypothetical protein